MTGRTVISRTTLTSFGSPFGRRRLFLTFLARLAGFAGNGTTCSVSRSIRPPSAADSIVSATPPHTPFVADAEQCRQTPLRVSELADFERDRTRGLGAGENTRAVDRAI